MTIISSVQLEPLWLVASIWNCVEQNIIIVAASFVHHPILDSSMACTQLIFHPAALGSSAHPGSVIPHSSFPSMMNHANVTPSQDTV